MDRPTPYRPRVPDDLFAELNKFSDGTFKGLHELTLRYIREGIEKDRAVQAGKERKLPGDYGHWRNPITINKWAENYDIDVMEVAAAYHELEHIALDSVDSVNGEFCLDGHDIKGLNAYFFGPNWERDLLLRELAEMETKVPEVPVVEKVDPITLHTIARDLKTSARLIHKYAFRGGRTIKPDEALSQEQIDFVYDAVETGLRNDGLLAKGVSIKPTARKKK